MANILVVDENEAVRTMLRRMLQSEGHDVVEAANGSEMLSQLRSAPVDLAFVERTVLDGDVGELLRRMRQNLSKNKISANSTMVMLLYVQRDKPRMAEGLTTPFTVVDVTAVLLSAGLTPPHDG